MSQENQRQFEVGEAGAKSPFKPKSLRKVFKKLTKRRQKGPSGSSWNAKHLDWLHVLLEINCNTKDMFSSGSELSQFSKIAKHLHEQLEVDWNWICNHNHESSNSIYDCLQALVHQREEDGDANTQSDGSAILTPSTKSKSQYGSSKSSHPLTLEEMNFRREREETPTPVYPKEKASSPKTLSPELPSRKRQYDQTLSPHRRHEGTSTPQRQIEATHAFHKRREDSPLNKYISTPVQPAQGQKRPSPQTYSPSSKLKAKDDAEFSMDALQANKRIPSDSDEEDDSEIDGSDSEGSETESNDQKDIEEENDDDTDTAPNRPPDAASKDKSEREVEAAGRAFLVRYRISNQSPYI